MKKILFAVAAIAAALLSSCNKQEDGSVPTVKEEKTFFGTIELATKTTLSADDKVEWESGDEININMQSTYTATPLETDPSRAVFTKKEGDDPLPPYRAMYPADFFDGAHSYVLPATQIYTSGKFNAPMYAESSTESLQFKNICGVFCFRLTGDDTVTKISIDTNAGDDQITGKFSIVDGTVIQLEESEYGHRNVTLSCGSGVMLSAVTPTDFHIYLPPKTYKAGMKITITYSDGKTYEKTTTKSLLVERNTIYTFNWTLNSAPAIINGKTVSVKTIKLWESGPKFAEYNLGVTDGKMTSFGIYYNTGPYYHLNEIAEQVWGTSCWRLPSTQEMQALINNCDSQWTTIDGVAGIKFTGRGDYSSNYIFLPAAGYKNTAPLQVGTDAYYSTYKAGAGGGSYCLHCTSSKKEVDLFFEGLLAENGMPTYRPVLK